MPAQPIVAKVDVPDIRVDRPRNGPETNSA